MNAEIIALNERCARAVGDCVHEWFHLPPRIGDMQVVSWVCKHCRKYHKGTSPPVCITDYCATAGSALEFCLRMDVFGGRNAWDFQASIDMDSIAISDICDNSSFVDYNDYDSIGRALGVAICEWCLEVLGREKE